MIVKLHRMYTFGYILSLLFSQNFHAVSKDDNICEIPQIQNMEPCERVRCRIPVPKSSKKDRKLFCSGCELLSIVNLLKHYNLDIDPKKFFDEYFIHQDWKLIDKKIEGAPHPYIAYPGDPKVASGPNCGFGCFAPVIKYSLFRFFIANDITNYDVVVGENISTEDLINDYVKKGMPVIIWCTQTNIDNENSDGYLPIPVPLQQSCPGSEWKTFHSQEIKKIYKLLPDNVENMFQELDGQDYTWQRKEHCALLIGETDKFYILNDPFLEEIYVDKDVLNKSREIFGNQMVALYPV